MMFKNINPLWCLLAQVAVAVPATPNGNCDSYGSFPGGGGNGAGGNQITIVNIVTVETVYFPVVINTFIQDNTILSFIGGITIEINNAPTQIMTVPTGSSVATVSAPTTVLPGNINIFQTTNIINFPVVISTFIEQNTIIQAGNNINIVINNAPTSILTTATGTSTEIVTVTSTVTTGNALPTSFLLAPAAAGIQQRMLRRQESEQEFIGPAGDVVSSCSEASVFSITDGQLSNGEYLYSTDSGVASAPFAATQNIGNISTTFSISDRLAWSNAAFSEGQARFCSSNGRISTLFTSNATIPGCVPQNLLVIPEAACDNGVIVSSSSASSSSTAEPTTSATISSPIASETSDSTSSVDPAPTSTDIPSTTSESSEATPTPTSAVCTSFFLKRIGRAGVETYVVGPIDATDGYYLQDSSAQLSDATKFEVLADSTIRQPGNGNFAVIFPTSPALQYFLSYSEATSPYEKIKCTVPTGASGNVTCRTDAYETTWVDCGAGSSTDFYLAAAQVGQVDAVCTEVSVLAIPAC